jgi:hypothetical protein
MSVDDHVKLDKLVGFDSINTYTPKLPDSVNLNDPVAKKAAIGSDILKKLDNMSPFEERGEPDLKMNDTTHNGKKFLDVSNSNVLNNSGALTGSSLQAFYDTTHDKSHWAQYYDNGHLLLKTPASGFRTDGGEFNGKVVFNVAGPMYCNTTFYTSDPNNKDASTLIYVGENGTLDNFGVGQNGNFSGLIYVDQANNKSNTFKWGDNTTLNGAVILKGGNLTWNSGSNMTTIRRDDRILKNYGFLLDSDNLDNQRVELSDSSRGLILHPAAYYFY